MADTEVKPTRSGRLLSLIRRMIDYGKELAATLSNPDPPTDLEPLTRPFGIRDIALILARIARGLQLAGALETHVVGIAASLDNPPAPAAASAATPPAPRMPAAPRPPRTQPRPVADTRLARMPTPEQIAASVRRRPIGAVIAAICCDLGIMRHHPLWGEIRDAVVEFGGDFAALLGNIISRVLADIKQRLPGPRRATPPAPASTGPPQQAAA